MRDLLVGGSLFGLFYDLVVDDLFFDFFFDFFGSLFNCFFNGSFLLGLFLEGGFFCYGLGGDLFRHCLDGLGYGLGKHLDGASLLFYLCLFCTCEITLGVVTLGGADGFVCGGCGGRARYGCCGSLFNCGLFNHGFFFYNRFFLNNGLFDYGLLYNLLVLGLVVIKLPGEVCVCGNNGLVLYDQLRYVIGIKLKGCRRLFLAQILANKTAGDERFGIGEGILLFVVNFFDINGRESLLFASALNELECKRELAGRVDLVKEGSLGVFLLCAYVLAAVNRILKRGRLKCQIEIKRAGANVDLCNLCMLVCVGINAPAHALLGAFIAHQRVADSTVILFGLGTGLHQLCLAALAIARDDVATRFFIKANDALVAKEIAFVFVVVLFCIGFSLCLILGIELVLGIDLINLDLFILGVGKGGRACSILCGRTLNGNLALHAELGLELHKLGDRLHHFLGGGAELLALAALGNGGGVGLLDDLLGGFDDMLFNDGSLSAISGCTLGDDGALNGLNSGNSRLLCNDCGLDCFLGLDGLFFLVFLGHNGILGGDEVGDSLKCCLVVCIVVILLCRLFDVVKLLGSRRLNSLLLGFSFGSCLCLCILCLLCRLCGNEQISLGIKGYQENAKHKSAHQSGNRQHQKDQLCRSRHSTKGQRG